MGNQILRRSILSFSLIVLVMDEDVLNVYITCVNKNMY